MTKSFINKARNIKQVADVWEVSVRAANVWVDSSYGGDPYRPWHVLVVSQNDLIIQQGLFPKRPSVHEMAEVLYKGMVRPMFGAGSKHRPTKVLVNDDRLFEKLQPELSGIDIECQKKEVLSFSNVAYQEVSAQFNEEIDSDFPSLFSTTGVTVPALAKLYQAAAVYFKTAPWKKLPHEEFAIEICYPEDAEPRYGIIIGRAGESFGLSVNDTWEDLKHFYSYSQGLTTTKGKYSIISFTYEKAHFLTFEDLDAIEKYGWDIPQKDAYPSVMRANPSDGKRILPLQKNDVFWLTNVLFALAEFFGENFDTDEFLNSFGEKEYERVIEVDGLSGKEKVSIMLPVFLS